MLERQVSRPMVVAGVTKDGIKRAKQKLLFVFMLSDVLFLFKKLSASVQMPGELHDAQILPVANLPEVWACFSREKCNFVLTFRLSASFHNQRTPYFGS